MTRKINHRRPIGPTASGWIAVSVMVVFTAGCQPPTPTLTERQVDELLSMPAQSSAASRELVQHDAQAREAWLALYDDLQQEVARIHRQQDELEAERKALAAQRRLDPILAVTIEQLGLLATCLLPMLIVALLLWPSRPQAEHEVVSNYLVETLIDQRKLPRIEHQPEPKRSQ